MIKVKLYIFQFLLLLICIRNVKLVPHKYCLPPLNTSDCGKQPTAVFSYYKPGSRCEIETWRGCPTANMFENEYHCSHYCIGRLKFFGRVKGSWTGMLGDSIYDLDTNQLDEVDQLLNNIDNAPKTDEDDTSRENLKNASPMRPIIIEEVTEDPKVTEDPEPSKNTEESKHTETTETTAEDSGTTEHIDNVTTTEGTEIDYLHRKIITGSTAVIPNTVVS